VEKCQQKRAIDIAFGRRYHSHIIESGVHETDASQADDRCFLGLLCGDDLVTKVDNFRAGNVVSEASVDQNVSFLVAENYRTSHIYI